MSSGDELASYEPTTPFRAAPPNPPPRVRRATSQGAVAGPSKPKAVARKVPAKRTSSRRSPEPSEIDEPDGAIEISSDSGEPTVLQPANKGKRKKGETRAANGRPPSKDKGKEKEMAEPPPKRAKKAPPPEDVVEVDEVEVEAVEESAAEEALPTTRLPRASVANGKRKSVKPPPVQAVDDDATTRQLERLRKQRDDALHQRDEFSTQIEALSKIRHTEAELALEQQSLQYEARLQTQESLIKELTTQLARVEPLARSGTTSSLHFLTREAADEEKRALERDLQKWKDAVREKHETTAQKDKRIAELEQTEKDLRLELNAEIERSKQVLAAARREPPPSATRGKPRPKGGNKDETPEGRVIRFYEDTTNLLVTNHVVERSPYPDVTDQDASFTCVYTHSETNNALNFTLRLFWDELPNESGEPEMVQKVKYTPHNLEHESPEFRDSLGFLSGVFTFERDQLHVFLKTVADRLGPPRVEDSGIEESMEMDDS
ncbi:hypothetical protein JAAARDRAFT_204689, partial [Jaapia argillacea MUCL 33604]